MPSTYTNLLYHAVFSTKGRRPLIQPDLQCELYPYLGGARPEFLRSFTWQVGYAAFTVSQSREGTVRRYIQNQEQHHRRKTFKVELIALLEKHKIEYDERYLWD